MSQKDYEKIALAIKESTESTNVFLTIAIRSSVANKVADAIAEENPDFDRYHFLKACGVE